MEFVYEVNDLASVTMTVDESHPDGAILTITNDSEQALQYGYDCGVQAEQDETWYDIKHGNMLVEIVQLELEAGQQKTFQVFILFVRFDFLSFWLFSHLQADSSGTSRIL